MGIGIFQFIKGTIDVNLSPFQCQPPHMQIFPSNRKMPADRIELHLFTVERKNFFHSGKHSTFPLFEHDMVSIKMRLPALFLTFHFAPAHPFSLSNPSYDCLKKNMPTRRQAYKSTWLFRYCDFNFFTNICTILLLRPSYTSLRREELLLLSSCLRTESQSRLPA